MISLEHDLVLFVVFLTSVVNCPGVSVWNAPNEEPCWKSRQ